jgi:PAS domain S-box-containing protein
MILDESMHALLGMAPGEFEGTRDAFRKRVLPEDLQQFELATLAAIEGRAPFEVEFRTRRADERVKIFKARGQIQRDAHGAPERMIGLVEDVTLEREAGEKIRKLSLAVEQSPTMVIITDLNGDIEYVNPKFSEVTGFSYDEVVGRNPRFLKSPEAEKMSDANPWPTIASGRIWNGEFCSVKKNGEIFWVSATIAPVFNSSKKATHFLSLEEDITARKEMQKALQTAKEVAESAARAKSQFLANMSHEIRTPLNAINGLVYLCQQTELDKRQKGYLRKIQVAANNLIEIINDILDFSKAEADKIVLETIEFDLDEILDNLSDLITGKAQEKGLEVVFVTSHEVPKRYRGDPLRLGQILINLANNAVKYTPSGEIVITTELVARQGNQATLSFSVMDTGIGMTNEQLQNLFKPFSQADNSITRRFGGTGLGLSICKKLSDLMNAEITVESSLNKGSVFKFNARFEVLQERPDLQPTSDLRGLNVLVIDDSEATLNAVKRQLQELSFVVETAKSLEEAIGKIDVRLKNAPFDLVLLDWNLHQINGLEAMEQIRLAAKDGNYVFGNLRIISTVPFGMEFSAERALGKRLESMLVKPFTLSTLLDTILRLFHKETGFAGKNVEIPNLGADIGKLKNARILLVEDNEINQEFASELLKSVGVQVQTADNGLQALSLLGKMNFDAVLMDIQMPEMDGLTATQTIRSQPEFENLPIIAMTAGAMSGDKDRALKTGMNDYVAKPIDPQQLLRKLVKWIAQDVDQTSVEPVKNCCSGENLPAFCSKIENIDCEAGISRMGGNHNRYVDVLVKFVSKNRTVVEKIQDAMNDGRIEEARITAHSLIGVSGNIGADEIAEISKSLEKSILENRYESVQELLALLKTKLDEIIAELERFLPGCDPDSKNRTLPLKVDQSEMQRLFVKISDQLRQGDSGARDSLIEFQQALGANSDDCEIAELNKFSDLICNYDYESALAFFPELEKAIKKNCPD